MRGVHTSTERMPMNTSTITTTFNKASVNKSFFFCVVKSPASIRLEGNALQPKGHGTSGFVAQRIALPFVDYLPFTWHQADQVLRLFKTLVGGLGFPEVCPWTDYNTMLSSLRTLWVGRLYIYIYKAPQWAKIWSKRFQTKTCFYFFYTLSTYIYLYLYLYIYIPGTDYISMLSSLHILCEQA